MPTMLCGREMRGWRAFTIDDSVIRRWKADAKYRPPGLVEYFKRNPQQMPEGTATAQRSERVYANKYWNETGVFLRPGVQYRITVVHGVGEPLRDAGSLAQVEGEEWDSLAHRSVALVHVKRQDDAKWFALIGTVDEKHAWAIQNNATFTLPVSRQLPYMGWPIPYSLWQPLCIFCPVLCPAKKATRAEKSVTAIC